MMPSNLSDQPDDRTVNQDASDGRTGTVSSSLPFPTAFFSQPIFEGRLHPFTLLFGLLKGLRAAAPAIPLILFGDRVFAGMLIMVFVTTVVSAFARYFSFSYRIDDNELITKQGILARKHRSIPLERVQEIRVEQGVFHRIFGVVEAKVETGGGEGAEVSLSVLSRAEAERLRQIVFDRAAVIKGESSSPSNTNLNVSMPERVVIRQLSIQDLVLAGLTSNHLLSVLFLAGAIWNLADDLIPDRIDDRMAHLIWKHAESAIARGTANAAAVTIVIVIGLFMIGLFFSVIVSIVRFYKFTFSRSGEDLHRSYGLITRRASSLPRRRIQVLEIEEKLLRRLFGLATLRADTSGSHREGEDNNEGRDVLIPILRRREVDELLPLLLNNFDSDQADWQRVSKLAIRRGTIKGGIICLALASALFAYQRELVALWPLTCIALVYVINVARYRTLAYAAGAQYFRTRRGWLGRSTHIVPINKIQAIVIAQTPLDRKLGLATLYVDTAGQAYTGGGPQISNLPLARAQELASMLSHKASTLSYKW